MTIIRLALLELSRFRGPWRRLVPLTLALIPLLYGAMYLWSNWDPYGQLDKVPVAVVIEDQPATALNQVVNAGAQFEQQLRAKPTFDWHFVDKNEAQNGLEHGRYYFTIYVPPNFSHDLVSVQDAKPERAIMTITRNDANNFIAGVMADTAKSELQDQVNSAAHSAYAQAIYGNLTTVKQALGVAVEGTDRLVDAAALGQQGTAALNTGLTGIQSGSNQVAQSVSQVADAADEADKAIGSLSDAGTSTLPELVGTLANTADAATQTLGAAQNGTGLLRTSAHSGSDAIAQLSRAHPELLTDPAFRNLQQNSSSLAALADQSDDAIRGAHTAAGQASAGAARLRGDVGNIQQLIGGATAPVRTLTASVRGISGGLNQLSVGINSVSAAGATLQTGADQLHHGLTQVDDTLHNGVSKIPDTNPQQTAQAADVLGSPVGIKTDNLNPATLYGRGLTPFFFSIALWVFGLFAYLLLKPVNLRAMAGKVSSLTVAAAGWLPGALLGSIGALVLYAVVSFGLHLNPLHPIWMAGLLVLAASTFVAIDHFLRTTFGVIGDVLSLVLLILQLTACGGLYPIETTPAPFQFIHPLLPMTYLVDGLRVTVSGGLTGNLVRDALVLAGFLVVFLGLTSWSVRRRRTWTVASLHPAIEL